MLVASGVGFALPATGWLFKTEAQDYPPNLELRFTLDRSDAKNPDLYEDRVSLGVKGEPRQNPAEQIERGPQGTFEKVVAAPTETKPVQAVVHASVRESYRQDEAEADDTTICLNRSPTPPVDAVHEVRLQCREGMPCTELAADDPGWVETCERRAEFLPADPWSLGESFAGLFADEAHAATAANVWSVPSLESLRTRQADLTEGFTTFSLHSVEPLGIDADGVGIGLVVNGTPVLVEGLPADTLVRPYEPHAPLALEFALQNLDFDGRRAGCDTIDVELAFYRDGERAGDPIRLTLPYAALRDTEASAIDTDRGAFRWSAHYDRSNSPNDWRIFVQSALLPSWDAVDDPESVERALAALEETRRTIDALGLSYEGRKVVGIIRPPLTRPSWGLALGTLQDNGQIDFTFTKDEAADMKAFVMNERSRDRAVRRLFLDEPFIYIEKRDVDRRTVCSLLQ